MSRTKLTALAREQFPDLTAGQLERVVSALACAYNAGCLEEREAHQSTIIVQLNTINPAGAN